MNKRVTIEMPDEMLRLIEQHLEDQYFLARAEEATRRIESGESQVVSAKEFWRGLDD